MVILERIHTHFPLSSPATNASAYVILTTATVHLKVIQIRSHYINFSPVKFNDTRKSPTTQWIYMNVHKQWMEVHTLEEAPPSTITKLRMPKSCWGSACFINSSPKSRPRKWKKCSLPLFHFTRINGCQGPVGRLAWEQHAYLHTECSSCSFYHAACLSVLHNVNVEFNNRRNGEWECPVCCPVWEAYKHISAWAIGISTCLSTQHTTRHVILLQCHVTR